MICIIKGAEVDGPKGEAGGKRHGVFAYHAADHRSTTPPGRA
jgi:hypothetical protein